MSMSEDIFEDSESCTRKPDTLEKFLNEDSLSLSVPKETVEKLLCTSATAPIPSMTHSDVVQNIDSEQNNSAGGKDENQLVIENDEFFLNIPADYVSSSPGLADMLVSHLEKTDYIQQSCTNDNAECLYYINDEHITASHCGIQNEATTSGGSSDRLPIGFDVTVETANKRKTSDYVYNKGEECLFAKPFVNIPFQVKCTTTPPSGSFIRVCAFYTQGIYASQPVKRCPHHLASDDSKIREHFIVAESALATYIDARWADERPHLTVPYSMADPLFIPLQFRCFSSCNGGINRRPVTITFSLEASGEVLGTKKIGLKVCACPSRDAVTDGFEPPSKRRRTVVLEKKAEVITESTEHSGNSFAEDDETVYEIQIRGRHLYKLVCAIVHNYELSRRYLKEKDNQQLQVNPLKSRSPTLSHRTSVASWLTNLNLSKYEKVFHSNSLYVLDDLEGVINKKFLLSIGIDPSDVPTLLTSYLSWFDVYNVQRLSTLSSVGSSIRIQRTRLCSKIQEPQ